MSTRTTSKLEWTPEMDEFLASHTLWQTATQFGTNLTACYKRSKQLGHVRILGGSNRAIKWTPEQDEIVKSNPVRQAMEKLGRSMCQVVRRRRALGIYVRMPPRKRSVVFSALRRANYNVAEAARALGISRQRMHQLIDKFDRQREAEQHMSVGK